MNPNTMTIEAIRDELARREGWENHPEYGWCHPDVQYEDGRPHPIPATLDEAAKIGNGWMVRVYVNEHGVTIAHATKDDAVFERTGDAEMEARFRLRLACTIADDNSTKH